MYASPKTVTSLRPSLAKRETDTSLPLEDPSTPVEEEEDDTLRFYIPNPYYSTPPEHFRGDKEVAIFEFGTRVIRAGFSGRGEPLCAHHFHPDKHRRVGDLRQWLPGYDANWRQRVVGKGFGEDWELWSPNAKSLDLKLVEDKLERAIRGLYTSFPLTPQSFERRFMFALPPGLPLPLIGILLSRFFYTCEAKTISLFPTSTLNVVAAGLRSGLVIDIGWHETVVSVVYEHREISTRRSTRATRHLAKETGRFLWRRCQTAQEWHESDQQDNGEDDGFREEISFDEIEDVMCRVIWCRPSSRVDDADNDKAEPPSPTPKSTKKDDDPIFNIPLSSTTPKVILQIPFSTLSDPTESTFFTDVPHPDDNELPLIPLIYSTLLSISPDIRGHVISRLIFVGGGSRILGLKARVVGDLQALIDSRGWTNVKGDKIPQHIKKRQHLVERDSNIQPSYFPSQITTTSTTTSAPLPPSTPKKPTAIDPSTPTANTVPPSPFAPPTPLDPSLPASAQPPASDPVLSVISRERTRALAAAQQDYYTSMFAAPSRTFPQPPSGVVRAVDTMGAWAGASLLANMKIPGTAVVERERFMAYGGMRGLNRLAEGVGGEGGAAVGVARSRKSVLGGMKARAEDGKGSGGAAGGGAAILPLGQGGGFTLGDYWM